GQLSQGLPQREPGGDQIGLVGVPSLRQEVARELAVPHPPQSGNVAVNEDLPDVRLGIRGDPGPGEPALEERVLKQVLSSAHVPRQEVREPEEMWRTSSYEPDELGSVGHGRV